VGKSGARLRAFGAMAGNLRVDSERRLVDHTRESWNRMKGWLVRLERLRTVA